MKKTRNVQENQKLIIKQKPTSQAIKKQVSEELDEQVSELVVESALKTSFKRKRKGSSKKNQSKKKPPLKILFVNLIWSMQTKNFNVGARGTNQSRGADLL